LTVEETPLRLARLREAAEQLAVAQQPPVPLLHGRDLIALGFAPGRHFGPILRDAFEAQLDGAFADHASALVWLRRRVGADAAATNPPPAP
jgi:tRNA nucleotidyltransferase (CCA-adding enzyme)